MDRRDFLKTSATAGAALTLGGAAGLARAAESPNVLLILCDQMRRPRWFPGNQPLRNYEALKSRGLEFTNHFGSAVPCSPSRACLMTGLHIDQHGVKMNILEGYQDSLDSGIPTLGHLFREAGYRTPYIGKWHLTTKREYRENDLLRPYGFNWIEIEKGGHSERWPALQVDPVYTDAGCRWLRENRESKKPWFLTVSLLNPHDICFYPGDARRRDLVPRVVDKLPENWNDDLSGKPRCQLEHRKAYAQIGGEMNIEDEKECLRYLDYYYHFNKAIDQHLGQVLAALRDSGQEDNTLVIFTSDHGDMCASHRLRTKGPNIYTENYNVPLIFSWPGRIAPGADSSALTQNIDLFPTFAELVGADLGNYSYLPGTSMRSLLANPAGAGSDHVLVAFTVNLAVKLKNEEMGMAGVESPQNIRAIRERDWVYGRYFSSETPEQEFELYDLKNDPLQMKNLAGDSGYRAKHKEMAEKLQAAEAREMAPRQLPRRG